MEPYIYYSNLTLFSLVFLFQGGGGDGSWSGEVEITTQILTVALIAFSVSFLGVMKHTRIIFVLKKKKSLE